MQSNTKTVIVALAVLFTISLSASQLEFRTESPIEFRSSLDLNSNTISNLSDPQTADQAVPESYISNNYLSRTDPTVQGNLALSDNGNIELRDGYISNDGDDEGLRVLDSGEVRIENGLLNLSGSSLTGLPASDDSNDAVRQDQLSNYVKLNGDTLDGNLSFDNQYYVTDLPQPENPEDAATKSFVESYADSNEQVISDDQGLQPTTRSGSTVTIPIENGSSTSFTDQNTQNPVEADLVAGSGLSGGSNDVLPGSNTDVTVSLNANDLDSQGNINDFSAASDLNGNGNLQSGVVSDNEISDNTIDNSEIQNSDQFTFNSINYGSTELQSDGDIDFNSGGDLDSVENLNVDSINSNKGSDPVDVTQGLDLTGTEIRRVATPDDSSDAATKGYVDSNSGGQTDGSEGNLNWYKCADSEGYRDTAQCGVSCPSGESLIMAGTREADGDKPGWYNDWFTVKTRYMSKAGTEGQGESESKYGGNFDSYVTVNIACKP